MTPSAPGRNSSAEHIAPGDARGPRDRAEGGDPKVDAVGDPEVDAEVGAEQPVADPYAGAFFDVDNTLLRGASIYYLARGLWMRDFFSTRELASAVWQNVWFRDRKSVV